MGKTTTAVNLAAALAVSERRTLLVDCDPQQSCLEWLQQRPADFGPISGLTTKRGEIDYPAGIQRAVLDAPARTTLKQAGRLIDAADVVLIPVLPSPIDIRAVGRFISELLQDRKARKRRIGVLANRVREHTLIYGTLDTFLHSLQIPFLTHLRDTQNYIRSAERGIGIFEMAPSLVDPDIEQWRPLIRWVEKDKKH